MPRTKKTYENAEYAAMVARMVKAYGRRLADSDPTDLPDALAMVAELDAAIGAAVRAMRASGGFSWAEIASYTGTTRQAAQQRWGKAAVAGPPPAPTPGHPAACSCGECAHRATA